MNRRAELRVGGDRLGRNFRFKNFRARAVSINVTLVTSIGTGRRAGGGGSCVWGAFTRRGRGGEGLSGWGGGSGGDFFPGGVDLEGS